MNPDTRGKLIAVVLLAVIGIGLLYSLSAIGLIHNIPFFGKPDINVDEIKGTTGFTGTKISFQIYNSGDAPARNVAVTITIYSGERTNPVESKHVFIGSLQPGESRRVTTDMETTGIKDAQFQIIPSYE